MRRLDVSAYRDRFTPEARKVLSAAFEDARDLGHLGMGAVHLFSGIARIATTLVSDTLSGLGVPYDGFLAALDHSLTAQAGHEDEVPVDDGATGGLDVSETFVRALHLAFENSQRSSRNTIDTVDLLLGVLRCDDPEVIELLGRLQLSVTLTVQAFQRTIRETEKNLREQQRHYDLPPYLRQFATNLNQRAAEGALPPLIGRVIEVQQLLEVLCHRERSNSAMLLGEAGVGKTAIVEGLAQLLEEEDAVIPARMRGRQILQLHLNSLVAGTMFRGMFEERIDKVLKEIQEHPEYILFIDEAHTMIGAGSAIGVPSDAANILKGALARGEVQIVGATTPGEYRRFVMEDEALSRRFRTIQVDEPDVESTREILQGVRKHLQDLYGVQLRTAVIDRALDLSTRYKRAQRRPDKIIGWLDTACVRTEIRQGKRVSEATLLDVISDDVGVPRGFVERKAESLLGNIAERLRDHVVGQDEALEKVSTRLRLSKGPLKENFARPDGVFLFLGPTGVGKTEVARGLARELFGDEQAMIRIDMSEFQAGGLSVDKLIGMPRGIVGSDRGGILTTAVQDKPYSIVLLDEIEKADRSVLNLFLQIFDEGWCADGRGRRTWFADTIIVMTSNMGTDALRRVDEPLGFGGSASSRARQAGRGILREVEQFLSPELLNRIDEVVVFDALTQAQVQEIAQRYLAGIMGRMAEDKKTLAVTDEALQWLARDGYNARYGARYLKRQIDRRVKLPLTEHYHEADRFVVDVHEDTLVILPEGEASVH